MEHFIFNAQLRARVGKGASRADRALGLIPATIYGNFQEPLSINLDPKEVMKQLVKKSLYNNIYYVNTGNDLQEEVLIRNIQMHPVTDKPIHVDMLRIGDKTVTRLEIPIIFHNHDTCAGIKMGGILNILQHYLEVACNPKIAPEKIEIDLLKLPIGAVIKIEDIELPEGVKTYYPAGFPIASITANESEATETE